MKRINTIDFVRGLVMIIMALDHIRDFIHVSSLTINPTDLSNTTPALFFTRWITHFCAPTFVFLSGSSAYLSFSKQQNLVESRKFLLTRGLWLIFLEFTVVNLGIWYDIHYGILLSQVIAVIGFSFIILSFLLRFSLKTIGIIGLILVFSHDLALQIPSAITNPILKFIASLFFAPNGFPITPKFIFIVGYPIIPWLGMMLLGFAFGQFFEIESEKRKKIFLKAGMIALVLFIVLRLINLYGDAVPWSVQSKFTFTILSFLNITKYPPSLLYTLLTLGVMFLVMSMVEGAKNKLIDWVSIFGKVPLFYYLIHWYLVHSIMIIVLLMQGFQWSELNFQDFNFGRPKGVSGVELPMVYLIWGIVILLMFPLCRWYGNYKSLHREKRWLRYL